MAHKNIVYAEVGKAIEIIQLADQGLKTVLLLVFPGKKINDLNSFHKNDKNLSRASLGKLIYMLKERVILNSDFETILIRYLEDRNLLVHNWGEIEGWNKEEKAIEFTTSLQKKAIYLTYIFMGFIDAWMEQVGINERDQEFSQLEDTISSIIPDWRYLIYDLIEDYKTT